MRTIALDAMGSDHAPAVEVAGAVAAARSGRVSVILVGVREQLNAQLRQHDVRGLPLRVHHADDVISMHDAPALAVRAKRSASMPVAARLVAEGQADALVSAGNSGAVVACGLFVLKRLAQVDRPGVLTRFPTLRGEAVLIDMGANVECRPLHLVQYAIMGAGYAEHVLRRKRPRVGVLANGVELHKGTELTRETDKMLRAGQVQFDYVGYVEGRDVFSGDVDVIVCDGFSGNLVLKVSEGVAETLVEITRRTLVKRLWDKLYLLPLWPRLKQLKKMTDYAEWGGAPLLGLRDVALLCHGGSNAKAVTNAILAASEAVERDLPERMIDALQAHRELWLGGSGAAAGDEPEGAPQLSSEATDVRGHSETNDSSQKSQNRRSGAGASIEDADQSRPRADGRHQRSVDHRTLGYQGAPDPRTEPLHV